MSIITILIAIAALLIIVITGFYNRFIKLVQQAREAWADIDTQLKRRYDLIPNIVETVKGYVAHESGTFQKVTEARTTAMSVGATASAGEHAQAENMLSGTLKSLFAVAENYPDLKTNTNFLELQNELSDTENKIQAARRFYNGSVRDLNIAVQSFPANIIAGIFGFKAMDFFNLEGEEEAREAVKVDF